MQQLLHPANILVIGDLMLDVYTIGKVQRISPEAPVPILNIQEEYHRAGGAGNAVLNLVSLGMHVKILGRVGDDETGRTLLKSLAQEKVVIDGVVIDPAYMTPRKNRMMADNQQLLRLDHESKTPLCTTIEEELLCRLSGIIEGVDVIAISDYDKGLLTGPFLQSISALANEKGIPIIIDPKGADFTKYHGATLIKPNLSEARRASGLDDHASLENVAQIILNKTLVDVLMITRAQDGVSLFYQDGKREDFPALKHEVKDVTGAGDTVLAVMTAMLANKYDLRLAAEVANCAASIAIERSGCARVSLQDLEQRLVEVGSEVFLCHA